jgi:predicted transcriptional regulator
VPIGEVRRLTDYREVADTYLSQIETGQRDIRWSTITRLLHALDATLADLAVQVELQKSAGRPS